MKQRQYRMEHAIFSQLLTIASQDDYQTSITELANVVRQTVPELIYNTELIETLKRLSDEGRLTLLKWSVEEKRFLVYPSEIADDQKFFYVSDFKIKPTPLASSYVDQPSFALGETENSLSKPRIGFIR